MVDEVIEGDLLAGALAFARRVLAEARPLRKVSERGDRIAGTDSALFADKRAKRTRRSGKACSRRGASSHCIEAACTRRFADAYALELAAYEECKASPQRAALIYQFNAERDAAKVPGLSADLKPQPIRSAAVIGAGTMGGGIAMCFANAGIPVRLLDASAEGLARGRALIEKNYADVGRARQPDAAEDGPRAVADHQLAGLRRDRRLRHRRRGRVRGHGRQAGHLPHSSTR